MSLDITSKIHIRLLFASVIILALVPLTLLIASRLNAEILHYLAEHETGVSKLNLAEQAVNLAPLNYKYRVQLARVNYKNSRPLHANREYKNSVRLRPTWPLAWYHLFLWEYRENTNLHNLDYLLLKSHQYGQFHWGLNNQLAKLRLRKENIILSGNSIFKLEKALSRQMELNPLSILRLAFKLEKEHLVCGPYPLDEYSKYLCQRMLKIVSRCKDHIKFNLTMKQCRDKYNLFKHGS